ncbi:MAG: YiiD C-terminal domain-containing protein [Dokdonella sp.]
MNDRPPLDAFTLPDAGRGARAFALGQEILATIPLARAMGLSISSYDGASLTMAAPLAPNINDKGCAFGGSLASVMTLAGWSLVRLALDARGAEGEIYVKDSTIRYLAPVWQDFTTIAYVADGDTFEDFFKAYDRRGKGRLHVYCSVPLPDGGDAAVLDAQFVAIAKR